MHQMGLCCKFWFRILLIDQQKEAPPISGAANVGIFCKKSIPTITALSSLAEVFQGHTQEGLSETKG